jgi:hypothetical protein
VFKKDNKCRVFVNSEEKVQRETDSLHDEKQLQHFFMNKSGKSILLREFSQAVYTKPADDDSIFYFLSFYNPVTSIIDM